MIEQRQHWSQQEDKALKVLVKKYGKQSWVYVSERMMDKYGIQNRNGKQCRERWCNNLNPAINKTKWSKQQNKIMFDAHLKEGNRWIKIAKFLPGRTDNSVKNNFYSIIRKNLRRLAKKLGSKHSTNKIKNIKPSILSNILSQLMQTKTRESQILFKLISDEDEILQFKPQLKNGLNDLLDQFIHSSKSHQQSELENISIEEHAEQITKLERYPTFGKSLGKSDHQKEVCQVEKNNKQNQCKLQPKYIHQGILTRKQSNLLNKLCQDTQINPMIYSCQIKLPDLNDKKKSSSISIKIEDPFYQNGKFISPAYNHNYCTDNKKTIFHQFFQTDQGYKNIIDNTKEEIFKRCDRT